mgnify:CR=1 FL=1
MKKFSYVLTLLALIVLTAGCALGEEGEMRAERLDVAQWPTPQPPVPTATATTFPMTTLEPTPTREKVQLATPEVEASAPELTLEGAAASELLSAVLEQSGTSGSEFAAQIRGLSGVPAIPPGLAPVGIGLVIQDQLTVRQGPGESYGEVSTIKRGDLMGILGRNEDRSWVYVITIQRVLGWVPTGALRITAGNTDTEPVLPPNPIAAFAAQLAPAASEATGAPVTGGEIPRSGQTTPLDLNGLSPVAKATGNREALNVRERPGADTQIVGTLARDAEVSILAVNQAADWALVETTGGVTGWVALYLLSVDGDLSGAPAIPTTRESVPGSVASTGASTTQPAVPVSNVSPTELVPVSEGDSGSGFLLSGQVFSPVASALGREKIDIRRGPADSFGAVDEMTVDLAVEILARNPASDWAVIRTPLGSVGWVPVSSLKEIEGSLNNAAPVLTAWLESNETDLYNGPGVYHDKVGKLAINDVVAVLGVNAGRSWLSIEAQNGGRGWVPLRLVQVSGSLDEVPAYEFPAVVEVASTGPALPPPSAASATTGQLVFQTASGGEIKLINADGTGLRTLTNGIDPVLSPDGSRVAFTRWVGDIGELWVINTDGSGERQILGEMRKAKGPDWSPDGSQIVLNFQQGGRTEESRICRSLSGNPTPPRNAFDFGVKINGEGKPELCWTLPVDLNWTLRTVNVNDGSFKDLYGGLYAFRPAWNPDQAWQVVSDAGNGLLVVDINRTEYRQQLTDVVGDGSPAFSPDGRFIAVATRLQNAHDIYRMNVDGGNRLRLTETPLWVPVQPENDGKQWHNVAPTWSPDGSLIAFLTDREGQWEVWVMNADGSNQRPLFPDEVNDQLNINYEFVDERVLSWR